jgi:hypothetical protein
MGVFKNGHIIWESGPIVDELNQCAGFFPTIDFNKDGIVEITYSWATGVNEEGREFWIYSWDGNKGNFVSTIDVGDYDISLVDIDGDGTTEMQADDDDEGEDSNDPENDNYDETKIKTVGYYKYTGEFIETNIINLPKNKLTALSKCSVIKANNNFKYVYSFKNNDNSIQKIEQLLISTPSIIDTVYNCDSPNSWEGSCGDGNATWFTTYMCDMCKPAEIKPGETKAGFSFYANFLPKITEFYAQGLNGQEDSEKETLIDNAYKGYTIGPSFYMSPFYPSNFIDSLFNEITKASEFSWIKYRSIVDKYSNYLSSAKTALQNNNIKAARTSLESIIKDVNIDSTSTLTSEAYALLRYNTEYLLSQLPNTSGTTVKLINSTGALLTGGTLQYYEGAWKDAVNNNDGTFTVNTTKPTISLRMTYEYGTQTKQNVPVGNGEIVFQTVNAQVKLQDSNGNLQDQGAVQYYAGAWRTFGVTSGGIASKELLPANYSFRMTYAFASKDMQQDLSVNPVVTFHTVKAQVQLKNSSGNLIDQGTVQYYAGAWRDFGVTSNGIASLELLPNSYSFRMTYTYASNDKQQDISINSTVVFQTINAQAQLKNSLGNLINEQASVQYYAGAWRTLGNTTAGVASKELLPNNYSFRMTYAFASKDMQQDINTNPVVTFQTVKAQVQLKNSLGNLIDQGTVQYYSGAWRSFGTTTNGIASLELLPNNYSFRMTYEYVSMDKQQDISTNSTVSFSTVLCTIRVKDAQSQPVNNAQVSYYSGAWRVIGSTVNGVVTKELLPAELSFRAKLGSKQTDVKQKLADNNIVEIALP